MAGAPPTIAQDAVLTKSSKVSFLNEEVSGYDWNQGIDYNKLLGTYIHSGFQATNLGLAIKEVNKMLECRSQTLVPGHEDNEDPFVTVKHNCTIFLGYTSNIVSCGLRESIRFLVQHKLVRLIRY